MNQNTRPLYDQISTKNRAIITSQPMQYMTKNLSDDRKLMEPEPENIDTSSTLRMAPTRLNYFNKLETELRGTAPYKLQGQSLAIDDESSLRYPQYFQYLNRNVSETEYNVRDFMDDPLRVDMRPRSSRVDLRNSYCSQSKEK